MIRFVDFFLRSFLQNYNKNNQIILIFSGQGRISLCSRGGLLANKTIAGDNWKEYTPSKYRADKRRRSRVIKKRGRAKAGSGKRKKQRQGRASAGSRKRDRQGRSRARAGSIKKDSQGKIKARAGSGKKDRQGRSRARAGNKERNRRRGGRARNRKRGRAKRQRKSKTGSKKRGWDLILVLIRVFIKYHILPFFCLFSYVLLLLLLPLKLLGRSFWIIRVRFFKQVIIIVGDTSSLEFLTIISIQTNTTAKN